MSNSWTVRSKVRFSLETEIRSDSRAKSAIRVLQQLKLESEGLTTYRNYDIENSYQGVECRGTNPYP